MKTKLHITLVATGLVGTLAFSGLAGGQTPAAPDPSSLADVVRFVADVDLSTTEGIRTLYERIRLVCGDIVVSENGAVNVENVQCRQALVDAVVAQADKAVLAALQVEANRQSTEPGAH